MVMFSYIWLEGLELKHINMSWTFDVQSDTRDCGPDLSRPFLIEKKQKQMVCSCAENSRSWSLWAFCRVGSKPPYIPHVMRNVCLHCMWRSSSSGGELGRKKSLVSSEHTHRNSWAAWMKICQVKSCRVFTGIWQAAKCCRCCENVHCKYMHILYGAPCVTLLPQCHFPGQLLI